MTTELTAMTNEIVETINSMRRPLASHLHPDITFCCLQSHMTNVRSALLHLRTVGFQ